MALSMWFTIIVLAVALSMDAFAVSVANGLCYRDIPILKNALASSLAFGLFQGLMPVIGYLIGSHFSGAMVRFDHWIALGLLTYIGGGMIHDSRKDDPSDRIRPNEFSFKTLLVQAVATSIDALAVGIGIAVLGADMLLSALMIAVVTAVLCFFGVLIGGRFGRAIGNRAELVGGLILVLIGIKIFADHFHHIF